MVKGSKLIFKGDFARISSDCNQSQNEIAQEKFVKLNLVSHAWPQMHQPCSSLVTTENHIMQCKQFSI
jgi:hypothetical protein